MDHQPPRRIPIRALEQLHSDEAMALSARNFYRRVVAELEAKLEEKRALLETAEVNYQALREMSDNEEERRLVPRHPREEGKLRA